MPDIIKTKEMRIMQVGDKTRMAPYADGEGYNVTLMLGDACLLLLRNGFSQEQISTYIEEILQTVETHMNGKFNA